MTPELTHENPISTDDLEKGNFDKLDELANHAEAEELKQEQDNQLPPPKVDTPQEQKRHEEDMQIAQSIIAGGLVMGIAAFGKVENVSENKDIMYGIDLCSVAYAELADKYVGVSAFVSAEAQAIGATVVLVGAVSKVRAQQHEENTDNDAPITDEETQDLTDKPPVAPVKKRWFNKEA